jgi:hypothetical protein
MQDLYETCLQFNIPISPELLVQLLDYCDYNHDSLIDYVEFANFLNWKDRMPSGFPKRKLLASFIIDIVYMLSQYFHICCC